MNIPLETKPLDFNDGDEISLLEITNTILRNWRVVVVLPVLLALAVGMWSLTRDRNYIATALFMPQGTDGNGAGGAAALAQQFGVNIGSDRPGQSPEFYVELLGSMTLLRQAVESRYAIPVSDDRRWEGTLIDYWELQEEGPTPPWHEAAEMLEESISATVSRQTGIVEIRISLAHPLLAEEIGGKLLDLLNRFNQTVRQNRAQEESRFIAGRLTEVQNDLLAAEEALQSFLRQNREFQNSPELSFQHDRLQRDVIMRQEVYTSLLRSQDQAQIDALRDTPFFTVIVHPAGTAEPQGRATISKALLAFMIGFILAVVFALVSEAIGRRRDAGDPAYREFERLVRRAGGDMLRPTRWLGVRR